MVPGKTWRETKNQSLVGLLVEVTDAAQLSLESYRPLRGEHKECELKMTGVRLRVYSYNKPHCHETGAR